MHANWRDCKAWDDEGLRLQTTNNHTAKLFDITLTQYVSMTNMPSFGGIKKSLDDMLESDPHFVLGRVLNDTLAFTGNSCSYEGMPEFRKQVEQTFEIAHKYKDDLTDREKLHVKALRHMREGWKIKACDTYDQILLHHPSDLLAHKLNQQCLFFLGQKTRIKDNIERVFKSCPPSTPLYHFLYGDLSFALCEDRQYDEAEALALKGISLYSKDSWASHALAHVYDMTGRYRQGIHFLDSTVNEWESGEMLSSHVHWHNALFNIEVADYERAVEIFNEEILKKRLNYKDSLSFVDASSLIYRLKLQGIDMPDNLHFLSKVVESHIDDHTLPFNDLHLVLALLGQGRLKEAASFVEGLEQYVSTTTKDDAYKELTSRVVVTVAKGLMEYERGNYEGAVEAMMAVMVEVVQLGGSEAQRDVFRQVFLDALIHSTQPTHHSLALQMMEESREFRQCCPLIDRYEAKFLALRAHTNKK